MIHCPACGYVPVPEDQLPVELPPLADFHPADDGRSPLAKATEWLHVSCPQCDGPAERETDTMDTFVDSSWYFMRYADPKNTKKFADPKKLKEWLPVKMYIGGPEHNTMHLLYARFITKALHAGGHLPFSEPFIARRNHSVILGPDGNRMSKSRGNVVDPDKEVAQYGADAVRMYLAFMGPYSDQTMPWDPNGVTGVVRFLKRVRTLSVVKSQDAGVQKMLNRAIKKVGEDIASMKYNTAIGELMKLMNVLEAGGGIGKKEFHTFLTILAPFAPQTTHELWSKVHEQAWPEYDPELLIESVVQIPVQVNGKVRDVVVIAPNASQDEVVFAARELPKIARYIEGATVTKVIYVPGKLLNLVVQ